MPERRFDFIVVGAGMAGASAASALAESASVALIEREERPGYHATGRSAAMLIVNYGTPAIVSLAKLSEPFLRRPPQDFCTQPLLSRRGTLSLGEPGDETALDEAAREAEANAHPLQRLSVDEIAALIPPIRRETFVGGLWDGESAAIDVDALHQGYLRAFRRQGGVLITQCEALAFTRSGGSWAVSTAQGELAAPVIVNAAGAWAERVGQMMGAAPISITPYRRTALLVGPPADIDIARWPLALHVRETYYFKPDAGKLMVSPADESPSEPCDVQPEEIDIAIAMDRFERAVDIPVRRVEHKWAGLRTFAPDRSPVVGFDSKVEGLFWLAGQGGAGIMTAPALSRMTAALARGKPLPGDFAEHGLAASALAPGRFDAKA